MKIIRVTQSDPEITKAVARLRDARTEKERAGAIERVVALIKQAGAPRAGKRGNTARVLPFTRDHKKGRG